MIFTSIIVLCLLTLSQSLPLQINQPAYQNSPLKWIYPGLQRPVSYQPIPIISSYSNNYQTLLEDNLIHGSHPALRQGFPANVINAIPFLPFHINVPDIVGSIIKTLQSIFGPVPILQQGIQNNNQGNVQGVLVASDQQNGLPIGMLTKDTYLGQQSPMVMPIPIIILVPTKQDMLEEYNEKND